MTTTKTTLCLFACLALAAAALAAAGTPGGYKSVDANDEMLAPVIEFCVKKFNEFNNGLPVSAAQTAVISASRQVVAGMNYRIVLRVSENSYHFFQVYDRFGDMSLVSHREVDERGGGFGVGKMSAPGGLPGGWSPIGSDAAEIEPVLEFGLAALNAKRPNGQLSLVRVVSALRQTVAGVNYRINFAALNTDMQEMHQVTVHVGLDGKMSLVEEHLATGYHMYPGSGKKAGVSASFGGFGGRNKLTVGSNIVQTRGGARRDPLLGQFINMSEDTMAKDELLQRAAEFVVSEINRASDSEANTWVLDKIKQAAFKIVQGRIYQLSVAVRSGGLAQLHRDVTYSAQVLVPPSRGMPGSERMVMLKKPQQVL